uniref:Uncharacterized protein n=1 Tax=Oryza nivara TaxID=4536 RepID=A0A0E0GNK4_ORYNI
MLGTHPRRQASTCQACLLAVPLSLLPNSLYYQGLPAPIPTQLRYVLLLRLWLRCNDKGQDAPMGSMCT